MEWCSPSVLITLIYYIGLITNDIDLCLQWSDKSLKLITVNSLIKCSPIFFFSPLIIIDAESKAASTVIPVLLKESGSFVRQKVKEKESSIYSRLSIITQVNLWAGWKISHHLVKKN